MFNRYFDLRMATKPNDINFYTVHALYGDPVMKELRNIKAFLMSHSKEILVLDFQHFYNFSESDHNRLLSALTSLFNNMICPYLDPIKKLNLNTMRQNSWQVINLKIYPLYTTNFGYSYRIFLDNLHLN